MEDLREEIKEQILMKIGDADNDDIHDAVYVFRDFVTALRTETETKGENGD